MATRNPAREGKILAAGLGNGNRHFSNCTTIDALTTHLGSGLQATGSSSKLQRPCRASHPLFSGQRQQTKEAMAALPVTPTAIRGLLDVEIKDTRWAGPRSLRQLAYALRRGTLMGPEPVAVATAKILEPIAKQAQYDSLEDLVVIIRTVGTYLQRVQPNGMFVVKWREGQRPRGKRA